MIETSSPLMSFLISPLAGDGVKDSISMVGEEVNLGELLTRQAEIDEGAVEILQTFLEELELNTHGAPDVLRLHPDFWPIACYLYLYKCMFESRYPRLRTSIGHRTEVLPETKDEDSLVSVGCLSLHVSTAAEKDPLVRIFMQYRVRKSDGMVYPTWSRPRYIGRNPRQWVQAEPEKE